MNKDKFKVEMLKIFPNISTVFFDKIEKYKLFLQKKNIEFNLTRLCDEKKVYSEYFYESIIPYKNLNLKTEKILDIGSGSGIPGIIIKLL
jgi:16S rRNA (guanine527-N7)-methyltransferase